MTLHLAHIACTVCERHIGEMRDVMDLDEVTEEGARFVGCWLTGYPIPTARFRDRIAPDLCDFCWREHRDDMMKRRWRRGARPPPFHTLYLWAWVARKLEDQARRLHPHFQNKADRGNERLARIY